VRVLLWHVHGSWTTSFVQGRHTCLIPTTPDRVPWGAGRPAAWDWPATARETAPEELADAEIDTVLLQRPEELELTERWTGRRPGHDLPAVYLEHNTPRGHAANTRHPMADRSDIPVVHVTSFNELMWDCGRAPTTVVRHGIVDPGERYTGELDRAAVVINEPIRRWRVTGTDLLPRLSRAGGIDVFGMKLDGLAGRLARTPRPPAEGAVRAVADLPQDRLHDEMARRRLYLHPMRWTSLGLSLIEAMQLGMPVVALAATEARATVPAEAGVVATDVAELQRAVRELLADPARAAEMWRAGRKAALDRFGLPEFLRRWDEVLARAAPAARTGTGKEQR
jgi:glycosyltransferase involved in cell wall biosynthesis